MPNRLASYYNELEKLSVNLNALFNKNTEWSWPYKGSKYPYEGTSSGKVIKQEIRINKNDKIILMHSYNEVTLATREFYSLYCKTNVKFTQFTKTAYFYDKKQSEGSWAIQYPGHELFNCERKDYYLNLDLKQGNLKGRINDTSEFFYYKIDPFDMNEIQVLWKRLSFLIKDIIRIEKELGITLDFPAFTRHFIASKNNLLHT